MANLRASFEALQRTDIAPKREHHQVIDTIRYASEFEWIATVSQVAEISQLAAKAQREWVDRSHNVHLIWVEDEFDVIDIALPIDLQSSKTYYCVTQVAERTKQAVRACLE
jgi:hypothetical protein